MGNPNGFLMYERQLPTVKSVKHRIEDYHEFVLPTPDDFVPKQASRCMDCGIPFCQSGCPLGNKIPAFNHAVYNNDWAKAYEILSLTNPFPEFTGRICPAPCEASCVLGIGHEAVTIELIEKQIIEHAYAQGWVQVPSLPPPSGKQVAVIGSGPAGLSAAYQLALLGHSVTIMEKDDRPGGLLRYGIPDFKLEKQIIDRRVALMQDMGIVFTYNTHIGTDVLYDDLDRDFDAIILALGSNVPREIIPDEINVKGVYYAMDFLKMMNAFVQSNQNNKPVIEVFNKRVVVIGGGDTGSDCVGSCVRQKAKSIVQIEILEKPSSSRGISNPWPQYPKTIKTTSSHEEGGSRRWGLQTKNYVVDTQGNLTGIEVQKVTWQFDSTSHQYTPVPDTYSVEIIPCDIVLIAAGFLHTNHVGIIQDWNIDRDIKGNIQTQNYKSNVHKVFAAGDARRGQSIVVWAIQEGKEVAAAVHDYLHS